MDDVSKRLKEARQKAGMTQTELAKKIRVSQGTIGDLERGRSTGSKHLPEICKVLGVSYEWMRFGSGDLNFSSTSSVDSGLREVPLISLADLDKEKPLKNSVNFILCPTHVGKDAFAIAVEGDAMSPRYPDGMIVYIEPELPDNLEGKRVVARVNDAIVFREYRKEAGDIYLMPLNVLYRPLTSVDVHILGVAVGSFLPE